MIDVFYECNPGDLRDDFSKVIAKIHKFCCGAEQKGYIICQLPCTDEVQLSSQSYLSL